jgi:uncharacterized protein YbaP (TraB family)
MRTAHFVAARSVRARRALQSQAVALAVCAGFIMALAGPAMAEPAMWIVHGPAGNAVLFGTDHGVKASPDWDTPRLKAAFDSSQELWVESIQEDVKTPDRTAGSLAAFLLPPGRTLPDELSPGDRRLLIDVEQRLKIDPGVLSRWRPAVAAEMILEIASRRAGLGDGTGVETVLEARATARGVPIKGLETLDPSVWNETLTPPEQAGVNNLQAAMKGFREITERRAQTIEAWKAGDLDRFAASCRRGMTPKLYEDLVASRNRRFVRRISERLNSPGTIFVAIGACHVVGKDSVPSLLRASGLTVEPQ